MTKSWHIPRRSFLRGLGTAVALPMLDGMAHAAAAKPTTSPLRMAFVYVPNGKIMEKWTPEREGRDYELPPTLEPIAPVKDDVLVLSRLAHDHANANGDGPGDHARSVATFLTGAQAYKTGGADIHVGVSVDQIAARKVGHRTRLASLELGCDRGAQSGSCDSGYSCAYSSNISWQTAETPMAKEINPRSVFERLFSSESDTQTAVNRARREHLRQSVLDYVLEDARDLQARLGGNDRRKLDEYLSSVREVERRIQFAEGATRVPLPEGFERPRGVPEEYKDHIRLMFDLMALAFQTDTTRIATLMAANAGSNRSYPEIGVSDGHHTLSHHRNDPDKIKKIARINQFHVGQFAYFLERLKGIREGEGTLLDQCMIVYGCAISDGNRHRHNDLPVLLAGCGGGTIQTGRHVRCPWETPLANLFLAMLDRMDAPVESFGDSTGRLENLDG